MQQMHATELNQDLKLNTTDRTNMQKYRK